MPKRTSAKIDLDFRPHSYWDHADPASAILQNIKGQVRRDMARSVLEGTAPESIGALKPEIFEDEIDEGTRTFLGSCHPAMMGGEYLPGYGAGEVEIARIALESTTGDVISFRARRNRPGALLRYSVVDEYETEYTTTRRTSRRPLSLRQLIELIDGVGGGFDDGEDGLSFVEALIVYGAEGDVSFASVQSELYPQLQEYYRKRLAAWAAERAEELGEQDEARVRVS